MINKVLFSSIQVQPTLNEFKTDSEDIHLWWKLGLKKKKRGRERERKRNKNWKIKTKENNQNRRKNKTNNNNNKQKRKCEFINKRTVIIIIRAGLIIRKGRRQRRPGRDPLPPAQRAEPKQPGAGQL